MAKSKNQSPKASDNGTDTDVLELPTPEPQDKKEPDVNNDKAFKDSPWFGDKPDNETAETVKDYKAPVITKGASEPKDDEQQLEDSSSKDEKTPDTPATPQSILEAMTTGEDNEFSLDDAEKKDGTAEGLTKEGEALKQKEKPTDTDIVSRIAREFEISDAQTPEQLISSIKEKLSTAKAGADAPVAGIDKVLALPNRDLYKTFLMRSKNFSDERAEKYINERVEMHGEEWIDQNAEDVRIDLESTRERIVNDHVARETLKEQESAKFGATARETVKEIKTLFKIPLKDHVAKLKEFQAKISTDEGLSAMRNDPKKLVRAMFAEEFGEQILEDFLAKKTVEDEATGWRKSYKANVQDKILNKSKVRELTESPNKGVKPSAYVPGGWD